MPELPEVEVVKKSLKKIVCLRIKSIEINSVKLRYKLDKIKRVFRVLVKASIRIHR